MCTETIVKLLIGAFFAFTFLQSGIDKILNKESNLGWFKSVFEPTIIGKFITPLFYWITLQEIVIGGIMLLATLCFAGLFCSTCFATDWGYALSIALLLQLFIGQRIAKDYVGATGIIPYIILALIGFLFLNACCGGDATACVK